MRNLQLLNGRRVADCPELSGCQRMAVDYDTGVVYCATATQILGLDPVAGQVVSQVDLGAEGLLAPDGSISIVGLQNIPDQMSVCAATSQGDVVLWNTTTGQIECVGSVDQGLTAMAWSPDQELLVLSTGNNTLILMTRDFDPITEVAMHQTAFGEAEFINVGWGKKETQFHGAVGKQAAHVKSEAVKPAHAWDDLRPRITWRGDGQFFAVSSINPLTNGRIMHVWTREGVLHSTSESIDGMEQALSWKPSGSLIASTQRKPNKHDVIFYERNGLQHGEFTLPFGIKEVKVTSHLDDVQTDDLDDFVSAGRFPERRAQLDEPRKTSTG